MEPVQVFIKGGRFIYRVDHRIMEGDCQYDHGPFVADVSDFYMDKYPVTNKQFETFLNESGYKPGQCENFLKHWEDGQCPAHLHNHPVIWVSVYDALAYCEFYNLRLPTDIQWQYAAGGIQKNKWPWGNAFEASYCNGSGSGTTPVDCYPENKSPFGCIDMCGNVYEWVNGIIDDGNHLFTFARGGSYYCASHFWHAEGGPKPNDFHLKVPLLNEALNRAGTVGFRCVKEEAF